MCQPISHRPTLADLLSEVAIVASSGDLARPVDAISHDSRRVVPGTLFVAYQGINLDVHRFLPEAFERGAVAALVERPIGQLRAELDLPAAATLVEVVEARRARALIAAALYDHPSRQMFVIGVTGTDGKTTTCSLIHAMLSAAGHKVGLVTTVAARIGEEAIDTGLHVTTPEPEDLQRYLDLMRKAETEIAVLEVTSHGLDQHRVTGVEFDLAVLTNITQESLEYHGSFERYRAAKARLFEMAVRSPRGSDERPCAILNADDPSAGQLAGIAGLRKVTYGLDNPAEFSASALDCSPTGIRFVAHTPAGRVAITSQLRGRYNAANILAAMAASAVLETDLDAMAAGVAGLGGVPGRMESLDEGQAFHAIVDFAHTPNALDAALMAARSIAGPEARVIAVFGCAGLRDPNKRPAMGAIAARRADLTIVTAEDPRTEDLGAIIEAVAEGAEAEGAVEGRDFLREADRGRAIRYACASAMPGDVVIVCGKGHEQSMCFGTIEYAWDDREALSAALRGHAYGSLPTSTAGPIN